MDRGLVAPEAILDGRLVVREEWRRHRHLRVECEPGPSYFLKVGSDADGAAAVAREAAVYRALAAAGDRLGGIAPRMVAHDPEQGVLTLELVPGSEDLRRMHARLGSLPPSVGAAAGRALALLHGARGWEGTAPPSPAPWALTAHRPHLESLGDCSNAALEAIRVMQEHPGLTARLDAVRAGWAADALVHGDVKWDNIVVAPPARPGEAPSVRLVDWELAGAGDPAWDIGSALAGHLTAWLESIPGDADAAPERLLGLARRPLASMRPAIAACWRAYVETRTPGAPADPASLERAVERAGVRLVQTALEAAQTTDRLTKGVVLHLQVAANVLARPREAARHLLGLPVGEAPG